MNLKLSLAAASLAAGVLFATMPGMAASGGSLGILKDLGAAQSSGVEKTHLAPGLPVGLGGYHKYVEGVGRVQCTSHKCWTNGSASGAAGGSDPIRHGIQIRPPDFAIRRPFFIRESEARRLSRVRGVGRHDARRHGHLPGAADGSRTLLPARLRHAEFPGPSSDRRSSSTAASCRDHRSREA